MATQHWGERGNPDEPIRFGDRIIEWACVGLSILIAASQAGYVIALLIGR